MINNKWAYSLETDLYSIIKHNAMAILSQEYPDIFFTIEEEINSEPIFPTVLIQSVEPTETNEDLEADRINVISFTTQVTVTTNKSRNEALKIANIIADLYKQKLFKIKPFPFARKEDNLWIATFRAKRKFGWNDIL